MNTGTNDSVMMSSEKNSAGPTSAAASAITRPVRLALQGFAGVLVLPGLDVLVRVLDHHHRGIHHRADGDRDAAERHDVGVDALVAHDDEGDQHAQRQRDDGHQRRAQVPQEQRADQRHDDELLDQLVAQIVDRALDQLRCGRRS